VEFQVSSFEFQVLNETQGRLTNPLRIFTCMDRMRFFLNEEKSTYRKWVNVITSLLLPGLGHFLSGRKMAAIIWFLANSGISAIAALLFVLPYTRSIVPAIATWLIGFLLWLWIAVDSCRKPIPRLSFRAWAGIGLAIIVMPIVLLSPRALSFKTFSIPTPAMMPTLMGNRKSPDGRMLKGDSVVVGRWSYRGRSPKRGDMIVFRTDAIAAPARERFQIPARELFVKRVVGLPGERVSIQPPSVYVNGNKVSEPKIFENFFSQTNALNSLPTRASEVQTNEVQLGPDEYYVVGDNVANSLDSRYFGPIKSGHFVGKVLGILWPLERRAFVQ
jgi:signal peptidase I